MIALMGQLHLGSSGSSRVGVSVRSRRRLVVTLLLTLPANVTHLL